LGYSIQFGTAHLGFEKLEIASLDSNHSETGTTSSLTYVSTFAYEYLGHSSVFLS